MILSLYNTRTHKKEPFQPQTPNTVAMYTCGPTVYNTPHIGNYRAFMTADLLRRVLRYHNYTVHSVMNITDVGHLTEDDVAQGDSGQDKMEAAALREGKTPQEIARHYEAIFHKDSTALGFLQHEHLPRATEHINAMIALIERLIAHGHAYVANGNVFYDVTTFPNYGALSGNTLEHLKVGARLSERHPDKRNQWDFALWLAAPPKHIMKWPSPWGIGYPGWHIECSAMSMHYLGNTLDIHLGGEDHIFPHHEAEIAQSEGATTQPFVHYWLHTRHMLVDGVKMSKSKGNTYTMADIIAHNFVPEDLRMLYLLSHYRSQMNFTWDALAQARKNRLRFTATAQRLTTAHTITDDTVTLDTGTFLRKIAIALSDDLNTPQAITETFAFLTEINTALDANALANPTDVLSALHTITAIFGITLTQKTAPIPENIRALAQQRDVARNAKDFARADALRDAIIAKGFRVSDTPHGTEVTR